MTKPTCTFSPEPHEYRIDGRIVPSVTQIIGDVLPGWKAPQWYLERGRANHACYALLAQGTAFLPDPVCEGFIAAWRKWAEHVRLEPLVIEHPVYSLRYRFAGTLDLIGIVQGNPMIVDYKGTLDARAKWQIAAYSIAEAETSGKRAFNVGVGVELRENGTFRMSEIYDLHRPRQEVLALLSAFNMRRELAIPISRPGGEK